MTASIKNPSIVPLKPGDTIGILGGGQLGRMLAAAAAQLGLKTIIYAPGPECPAAQLANQWIDADYSNTAKLAEFGQACNVITYEFENIPSKAINLLANTTPLYPEVLALDSSCDRLSEKQFFKSIDVATAAYFPVDTADDLRAGLSQLGGEGILKTRRFGYDGKGQVRITGNQEVDAEGIIKAMDGAACILEGFVDFSQEVSIVAARGQSGDIKFFDPAENHHENGILRTSRVPANIDLQTTERCQDIARKTLEKLNYIGVLAIEYFVLANGQVLVNEFAPRVHNSGHWTTTVCDTSQFEQHIRAIAGWPLGATTRRADCEMTNIIGAEIDQLPRLAATAGLDIEIYGKSEAKPGRKMGHYSRIIE